MSLKNMHFRCKEGATGDTMPFYHGGKYHMFVLTSTDGSVVKRNGDAWSHLVSDDYVHWEFVSKVVEKSDIPGTPNKDGAWTGSVAEKMVYSICTTRPIMRIKNVRQSAMVQAKIC